MIKESSQGRVRKEKSKSYCDFSRFKFQATPTSRRSDRMQNANPTINHHTEYRYTFITVRVARWKMHQSDDTTAKQVGLLQDRGEKEWMTSA